MTNGKTMFPENFVGKLLPHVFDGAFAVNLHLIVMAVFMFIGLIFFSQWLMVNGDGEKYRTTVVEPRRTRN